MELREFSTKNKAIARLLLKQGVNPEARNILGDIILKSVVKKGHDNIVEVLLEEGADIKAEDDNENTALEWAVNKRNIKMVRLLLEKGVNVFRKNKRGLTLLFRVPYIELSIQREFVVLLSLELRIDLKAHFGASPERRAMAQLLLEQGIDPKVRDNLGRTVLHSAAAAGSNDLVQLLIENGADMTAKDDDGCTALEAVVSRGKTDTVWLLLEYGANIFHKDKGGKTLLVQVILIEDLQEREAITQLLLEQGINPNVKDKSGKTALDFATKWEHNNLVQLLTPLTQKS